MSSYAVTASGVCPKDGVRTTISGGEIDFPEDNATVSSLGDPFPVVCLCGEVIDGAVVVALTLDPWRAVLEEDDDG